MSLTEGSFRTAAAWTMAPLLCDGSPFCGLVILSPQCGRGEVTQDILPTDDQAGPFPTFAQLFPRVLFGSGLPVPSPHYPRTPDKASKGAQEKWIPDFRGAPDNGAGNACNVC